MRAVKKEQKHYHVDWGLVSDPSKRFGNLVPSHLLKWVNWEDISKESFLFRFKISVVRLRPPIRFPKSTLFKL